MNDNMKIKYFDEELEVYDERRVVNKNTYSITLNYVPSPTRPLTVENGKQILTETNGTPNANQYVLDRENGLLLFNQVMKGKVMTINYSAIGLWCISADKIYTNVDNKGKIVETLEDLMRENRQAIESIKTVGDASTVITQLQANIDSVTGLVGNIAEGSSINEELTKSITSGKGTNTTLTNTISNANNKINEMNTWVNQHGDIVNLDNRVDTVEVEIPKINEQLETNVRELDSKKMNKTDVLSMANMGQDVKEAMTGGSVAVVGRNAILEENIADEQVTPEKLSIFEKTKENLWVIDNASYNGMSINYSYDDFFTKFKGTFTKTSRMLIKSVYLSSGTWSIVGFDINGLKPSIYVYSLDEYTKSNWSNYVGVYAKASTSTNITIPNDGYYCIVVYGGLDETYDCSGRFVLSKNNYESVTEFIANTYKLKDYINISVKNEYIPNKSITAEKTDFVEKTTDNLWDFENITNNGFLILYDYATGITQFIGSVSTTNRFLIKQTELTQGMWSIKAFDYTGLKPTVYIYKKTDYDNQNWSNFVGTFSMAGYKCDFDIVDSGEYCLVAYVSAESEFNYNGKIVLSQNNSENVTSYIPIKYKFKGYNEESVSEANMLYKGLKGKKLSILGVSIDTYENYIVSGNKTYYTPSNLSSVNMTWWKKLLNKTGMVLDTNNSWSGACATTTKNLTSSGVQRCTNLGENPDFIIISAFALNDWANSNLTFYNKDTMNIPIGSVDLTIQSNYDTYKTTIESYGGAMATIFYRIMEKYKSSKIFVCDAYNYYRDGKVPFTPTTSEPKINICNEILYDVARQFGIEVIRVSECGINAFNSLQYCVETGGTIGLHPNDLGHTLYSNKILDGFSKYI